MLIFFDHHSLLSQTISAIKYNGFGLVNPNTPPLSIQFCIEGTFKKINA
jgi:hypothetical protein